MKIYYVESEVFQKMKNSGRAWNTLCESFCDMPTLAGGLDYIQETKKQFIFYDRGCNNWDNSFIVRPVKS